MADDVLGSLRINVSADLSDLQEELAKIPGLLGDAMAALSAAGTAGGDAFEATAGLFEATGAAAAAATPQIEGAAVAVAAAGEAAGQAGPSLEGVQEAAISAAEGFKSLLEEVGLAVGAFEILKESLTTFSQAQDLISSFTLLSGSAETASMAFDDLKEMSDKLGISTDNLITVAQRLAPVFGVGTESAAAVMTAAADAAKAAGVPFETVALSLERIETSGQLTARQLVAMGISMDQVAETMSNMAGRTITVSEALGLLKKGAMDAATDTTIAIQTIEDNMGGAAATIAQNLSGQFQELKNTMHEVAISIGDALAPLALSIIATFNDMEPTLMGIGSGAHLAAEGIGDLATALQGVVPDFLKMALSAEGMISLGTAVGFVAQAVTTLVDILHAAVLYTADLIASLNPFSDGLKNLINDFKSAGVVIGNDIQGFADIATAGDKMAQSLKTSAAMAKAAIGDILPSGDTFAGIGGTSSGAATPPPDFTNQLLAQAEAKKVLTQAGEDLKKADADYAEFIKATYVPAILTIGESQKNVADALAVWTGVESAMRETRAAIAAADQKDTVTLAALENTFADQAAASQVAHEHYTQALKDQTLSKSTLATVTKDLDSAEAAIASATRATYIPAVLDHVTALQNIADAEDAQQTAIQNVKQAEADLSAAYANATKDANGNVVTTNALKTAEDNLAASKVALTGATTKLTQAHKDETTSANLLLSSEKLIDATEVQQIATRAKLLPATTSIQKATADYTQALKDTKDASMAVDDAELDLSIARGNSLAGLGGSGQGLIDAEQKLNLARGVLTTSTKNLDDTQKKLVDSFHLSKDAIDELTSHTGEYTDAQNLAVAETSELGIPSLDGLTKAANKSAQAYNDLASNGFPNYTVALEASIKPQQDAIDKAVQMGEDTTTLRINLDQTTSALQRQTQGWFDVYKALNQVVTTDFSKFADDLVFHFDQIGTDFKKLGEDIVDTILNGIIKQALTPLIDSMDKLIVEGVKWLADLLGLGGIFGTAAASGPAIAATTANTTAVTANTAALTALTSAIGTGTATTAASDAGGAGGAGGGAGGVGSALTGWISAISSAVSAITDIIGVFQSAHEESELMHIEENTRTAAQYATYIEDWIQNGLVRFNNESLFPELAGITQWISNTLDAINLLPGKIGAAINLSGVWLNVTGVPDGVSDLSQLVSFNWNQLAPDLFRIQSKLDLLNQSVVSLGSVASKPGAEQPISVTNADTPTQQSDASAVALSQIAELLGSQIVPLLVAIKTAEEVIAQSIEQAISSSSSGSTASSDQSVAALVNGLTLLDAGIQKLIGVEQSISNGISELNAKNLGADVISAGVDKLLSIGSAILGVISTLPPSLASIGSELSAAVGVLTQYSAVEQQLTQSVNVMSVSMAAGLDKVILISEAIASGISVVGSALANALRLIGGEAISSQISALTEIAGTGFQTLYASSRESLAALGALVNAAMSESEQRTEDLNELTGINAAIEKTGSMLSNIGSSIASMAQELYGQTNQLIATIAEGISNQLQSIRMVDEAMLSALSDLRDSAIESLQISQLGLQQLQFDSKVYLDGQELFSSFVTYLTQSGIKMPQSS